MFYELATTVGAVIVMCFLYEWGKIFFSLYLARIFGFVVDFRTLGDWAVVTGATDGIGKAFARELAFRGLNIVLLGRNADRLRFCAEDLEQSFKVKTIKICVDFVKDDTYCKRVTDNLSGLDVAVLINNVGMCPPIPDYFHTMSGLEADTLLTDVIRCNSLSVTNMTRICLPKMLRKKSGVIINIASASALIPTPLVAIYSATKAYVDVFSRALALEVAGTGVIVQSLLPFTVQTKMTGNPDTGFFVAEPGQFASSCLDAVSILTRNHGCLGHFLQAWYFLALPECISASLQWRFFSHLRSTLLSQTNSAKMD